MNKTITPYTPGGEFDNTVPLTDQERELAEQIFRAVRALAHNVNYGDDAPSLPSRYSYAVVFDEGRPLTQRVSVHYQCHEFSSGYYEDGFGPDLATAIARMSDDVNTNGSPQTEDK